MKITVISSTFHYDYVVAILLPNKCIFVCLSVCHKYLVDPQLKTSGMFSLIDR